ncbi:hypothetical protein [Brachybacterium sacelli]|uniref:hypothetical protein n=1 Tax=Brachybacterium sacelli TaxID=173364 RepID=UPI0036148261
MPDPIALVPLPRSVIWSEGVWETSAPWDGLSVGLTEDLPRTEYALSISRRAPASPPAARPPWPTAATPSPRSSPARAEPSPA